MRHVCLPVLAAVVIGLVVPGSGLAAPDAGAKARGDYNFYGHTVSHAFTSARAHVDTYQRYLSDTHDIPMSAASSPLADPAAQIAAHGEVDPEIAREASDAIADDIGRIQRHVNRMRAQAKSLGDAEAVAQLADVEKQLGVARRAHAALHQHHAGEEIAPATAMELCRQVNDALRAAHSEHDEVMRRLVAPAAR